MNYVTVNRFHYQDVKQTYAKIALFPGVCTIYSNLSMVCTTPHAPPPPPSSHQSLFIIQAYFAL